MGRGKDVSESVAKSPRAEIGREEKRGISTIRFLRFDSTGAFATDSDTAPPRVPAGAGAGRTAAATGAP